MFKKWLKLDIDSLLIGAGLLAIVLPTIVLLNEQWLYELSGFNVSDDSAPIGYVAKSNNDVRRRANRSITWMKVFNEQTLYEDDAIFSGPESVAVLQIENEDPLFLGENSLVYLTRGVDGTLIDLEFGSLAATVQKGKELNIRIGNKISKIKSSNDTGRIEISRSYDNKALFKVPRGEMSVEYDSDIQKLTPTRQLAIDKEEVKVEESQIALISKDNLSIVTSQDDKPFEFDWESEDPNSEFDVEVSKAQGYKPLIYQSALKDSKFVLPELTESGSYTFKVGKKGQPKDKAKTMRFVYLQHKDINLKYPINNQKIRRPEGDNHLAFYWEKVILANGYEVEVDHNAEFKNPQKIETKKANALVKLPQGGQYFWRVKTFVENAKPVTSDPQAFELEYYKPKKAVVPAVASAPVKPKAAPEKAKPKVQFNDFGKVFGPELPEGQKKLKPYDPFEKAKVSVEGVEDVLKEIDPLTMDFNQQVKFKVDGNMKGKKLVYEVRDSRKKRVARSIASESVDVTLKEPGRYDVLAYYIDDKGRKVKKGQAKKRFEYKTKLKLQPPKLLEPLNETEMVTFGQQELVMLFDWAKVSYAEGYEVQLATDPEFKELITKNKVRKTNFQIANSSAKPKLYWRVRTIFNDETSPWSEVYSVNISNN